MYIKSEEEKQEYQIIFAVAWFYGNAKQEKGEQKENSWTSHTNEYLTGSESSSVSSSKSLRAVFGRLELLCSVDLLRSSLAVSAVSLPANEVTGVVVDVDPIDEFELTLRYWTGGGGITFDCAIRFAPIVSTRSPDGKTSDANGSPITGDVYYHNTHCKSQISVISIQEKELYRTCVEATEVTASTNAQTWLTLGIPHRPHL